MNDTISEYGLRRPAYADLITSLSQVLHEQELDVALSYAREEVRLSSTEPDNLTPPELLRLADALTRQRGLTSIVARSFSIRLTSYLQLETRPDHG